MAPHFLTVTGYLKIVTVVLGFVVYGLAVYSYDETILQEEYFLRAVQISALISVIIFAAQISSEKLASSEISRGIDVVWHLIGALAILLGAGLVLYSTIDNQRSYCEILHITFPDQFCQFFKVKLAAGLLAVLNGILYAVIATVTFIDTLFPNSGRGNGSRKQPPQPPPPRLSTLPKCSYYYGQRF